MILEQKLMILLHMKTQIKVLSICIAHSAIYVQPQSVIHVLGFASVFIAYIHLQQSAKLSFY